MTSADTRRVLDQQTAKRKIKRMALEIAESNIDEKEILLAAVNGNGEVIARAVQQELQSIGVRTELSIIRINKRDPLNASLDHSSEMEDKVVLIIDDVASSGRTMMYALKPFLEMRPKKIQTLVLVERTHKLFPLQTDYKGVSIATTLQEHISVEVEGDHITGAWLS